jgi:hypothetical protein
MIERAHFDLSTVLELQLPVRHWQSAMTGNKDTQMHSMSTPFIFFVYLLVVCLTTL